MTVKSLPQPVPGSGSCGEWGFVEGCLCRRNGCFLFTSESELLLRRPQRWDQTEYDTAGAFSVNSCNLFSLCVLGAHETP